MARGINKVILVGNVGQDPEIRYMTNGNAVATLSLATSESWKDKETGNKQERTEWHRVVCFARLGEIIGEYVRKGSKLYVEGSLRTNKWQDKQGQDRYTTEIIASDVQMLDNKASGSGPSQNYDDSQPVSQYESQYGNQQSSPAAKTSSTNNASQETFAAMDDDIPF